MECERETGISGTNHSTPGERADTGRQGPRRCGARLCAPTSGQLNETVVLRRGTVAGLLKPVEEVCEERHKTGKRRETPIAGVVVPEHLRSMVEDAHVALNDSQREQVSVLVCRWAHVFAMPDGKLGNTPLVEHRIDTGDAPPIKQRPRRQAWAKREVIDREVEKMLEADVIEPCSGPWASPIVIVTKKDGTPRVAEVNRASLALGSRVGP